MMKVVLSRLAEKIDCSIFMRSHGECATKEPALTDSETLDDVIKCLAENFAIETQGVCDQQTLFEILVKAASSGDSRLFRFWGENRIIGYF